MNRKTQERYGLNLHGMLIFFCFVISSQERYINEMNEKIENARYIQTNIWNAKKEINVLLVDVKYTHKNAKEKHKMIMQNKISMYLPSFLLFVKFATKAHVYFPFFNVAW